MGAGSGWRNVHHLTGILCLKCTDLLVDPTHYIIGVPRTRMTNINHRCDARVYYSSTCPNGSIISGKQQKLLLAIGSNARDWCLGEKQQYGVKGLENTRYMVLGLEER